MSKAEHIEIFVQEEAPNNRSTYGPAIRARSEKSMFVEKWMPVISLGCLPLICAAIFAVQGSPRVLESIVDFIKSLF